jgi:subtilisin family serine protease
MTHRQIMITVLIVGIVLLVGAGIVYFSYPRSHPAPLPEIAPPSSLAELAEQYPDLASILNDAELDSIYKQFLVAYEEGGFEAALELARQRGLLTPDGDVRVSLLLDTDDHAALVAQLKATGVTVVSAYRDRLDIAVPIEQVEAQLQTEEPGAIFAQLTELEHVIAVRLPEPRVRDGSAIEGEGVDVIGADAWHQAGFTGAGLRIGILDLSFSGYESLLGTELPDQVTVETFGSVDTSDPDPHGVACAEIIHEIAPDAELIFAWYDGYDAAFGEAVDWLEAQEVHIISHSANGYAGPFDGSRFDSQRVDSASARGILWVNSAGNEALSHYRGTFTDEDGDGLHEFAPDEESLALYNNEYVQVILNWEDDWERATQDYELFLYDADGNELASSQDTQAGEAGQEPVEGLWYETGGETVYAVVKAYEVDRAVTLDLFLGGAEVAYPSPDHSVCSPADAVSSLTVGAVNWWDDSLASYSSQGPTADGRLKPEISAPTSVSGASYGNAAANDEYAGFSGTSAACPHIAGAAALVWQAHPEFSRQEVVDSLLADVVDLGASGPDTGYGYGRLQLPPPPGAGPISTPVATPVPPPTSGPAATPASLPTSTPVAYVTPVPAPRSGAGRGLLGLSILGLLVGGIGCAGMGLLFLGGIGLLIVGRRARRVRPRPVPSPVAGAPPPHSDRQPRYCRHCGAQLREEARFCPQCGKAVQEQPRETRGN